MSSKIGTIISLIFVAMMVALSMDIMCIQYLYSNLDAKSSSISYEIAKHGMLDSSFINYLNQKYKVTFICESNCEVNSPGTNIAYRLETSYKPIIISKQDMKLVVHRYAVLSFYD